MSQKRATSVEVLEDGKILVKMPNNKTEYIQPPIQVDTLDNIEVLEVSGLNQVRVHIDTTITEIDNVAFAGTFEQLETSIRGIAKDSNALLYAGGASGGGGTSDVNVLTNATDFSTETTQLLVKTGVDDVNSELDLQTIELESIDDRLRKKGLVDVDRYFLDFNSPDPGFQPTSFPVTLAGDLQIVADGNSTLYPESGVYATMQDLADYWNSIQSDLTFQEKTASQMWVIPNNLSIWGDASADFINFFASPVPGFKRFTVQFLSQAPRQEQEPANSNLDCILEKVCEITELVDTADSTTVGDLTAYSPGVADNAENIVASNPLRQAIYIQIEGGDAWIRLLDETIDPTSRKGFLVPDGGLLKIEPKVNGRIYKGVVSVINISNGSTFNYSVTQE